MRTLVRCVALPAGWRHVQVTEQRPTRACAPALQGLVDSGSPDAEGIRVVLDQLHPQKIASFYDAFAPAEARRLARTLAWQDTPKHGRGLHIADIAWSGLPPQCIERRLPDDVMLQRAMAAWEHRRNAAQATIDGGFLVTDARKNLARLSPSLPT